MTRRHPANDFKFDNDAEEGFVEWFHDLYGGYSLRSEWFFDDVMIEDEKQRIDILASWLHSAYISGWEASKCATIQEQEELTE